MSFISISKASEYLNISADTLRNWESQGKIKPERTQGGARRYNLAELQALKSELSLVSKQARGMVSISKAAKSLGVSTNTLRIWDKTGLINAERTKGGARRFTRAEINRIKLELDVKEKAVIVPKNSLKLRRPALNIAKIMQNFFLFCLLAIFMGELVIYGANIKIIRGSLKNVIDDSGSKEYMSNISQNLVKTYNFVAESYYSFFIFGVQSWVDMPKSLPEFSRNLASDYTGVSQVLGAVAPKHWLIINETK